MPNGTVTEQSLELLLINKVVIIQNIADTRQHEEWTAFGKSSACHRPGELLTNTLSDRVPANGFRYRRQNNSLHNFLLCQFISLLGRKIAV